MAETFLKPVELLRGPDVLRPGYLRQPGGEGKTTFLATKYADEAGERFFTAPASVGHETMITQPNVMRAMFGPELADVQSSTGYMRPEYAQEDGRYREIGKVVDYDYWKVRQLAMPHNLFGRYGVIRSRPVLMLWNRPDGFDELFRLVLGGLKPPLDTVLTVGGDEVGTVRDHAVAPVGEADRRRMELLTQYHVAIGAEKQRLADRLGLKDDLTGGGAPTDPDRFPWKRGHYRAKGREHGLDLFSYGEWLRGEADEPASPG